MSKKTIFTLVVTIIFVIVAAVFQYLHSRVELEVVAIDDAVKESFDPTLTTSFVDDLSSRLVDDAGPDLGY